MAIQSMTGFARHEAGVDEVRWVWELRSVNGKSLDVRLRLPSGMEALEPGLKAMAAEQLSRGNIQVNLQLDQQANAPVPVLNQLAFDAVYNIAEQLSQKTGMPKPDIGTLMAMKGVIEFSSPMDSQAEQEQLHAKIAKSFAEAISSLAKMRTGEGAAIVEILLGQVSKIEMLSKLIDKDASRSSDFIAKRLKEQLSKIIDDNSLDSQRLHQEAAILATKADLQEELDRLSAHVFSAKELLNSDGAVGRKLDFLSQEFNRECNTICSKSNSAEVTKAGLEMKVVIDQFREQVQNIQ